jgi:hypothetical protein
MSEIITDEQLLKQFAEKAMEEPAKVIKTRAPSESEITLPGGHIDQDGQLITTAEVKELTGADEEAVAKTGSSGKALNVLIQRGLVKLGNKPATSSDLDTLLSGDRDAILLGIRRVTFGPTVELRVKCFSCADEHSTVIDLVDDVPVQSLENPIEDRRWEMDTKLGKVVVALPNGITQRRLSENYDKTPAEINTLLLSGCIVSLDGLPTAGASTALSLGMADRTKVIDEIIKRNPGPRLGEVKKACKACGEPIDLPLSLLDLFRI